MEKRDCQCITHEGPHWLHIDVIRKEHNHAMLEQAGRYEEAAKQAYTRIEYNRWLALRDNLLHCYDLAELERLNEKERALKRFSDAG